jgi:hypothetical protein
VYARLLCGDEFWNATVIGERDKEEGGKEDQWEVKYCDDASKEWLGKSYVKLRTSASSRPQVASPPKGTKKKRKKVPKPQESLKTAKKATEVVVEVPKSVPDKVPEEVVEEVVIEEKEEVLEDVPVVEATPKLKCKEIYLMGGQGKVEVPTALAFALSDEFNTDEGFAARKGGSLRRMQQRAMEHKVRVEMGFSKCSPFYDLIRRGHKLVESLENTSTKWFNKLDDNGLAYKLEGVWTDFGWCPFSNLRINTCGKTTEVTPIPFHV